MEEKLDQLLLELRDMKQNMASKDELLDIKQAMATKEELLDMKQMMVTKEEFHEVTENIALILERLDAISKQLTVNTEQQVKINDLSEKVLEHDLDIKVLKKMLTT
ncbi:hypothetical protein [Halalkalibacter krulwichiae]|uniref:Uncharacterized protein n=1 Tax=Halalkalibacter krulwichiae TaxID=199441 RepID=A0A1X9M9R1_9BACI|nr:hypothetical protein [Halalkalibacter krulwichiae]ARK30148.1 hypothetical protein BkAM31D_09905 [Halalkalibacter krulwichiae]